MTSSHSFRLRILRSGSSGNAIFLEAAGTRLIIDVGLPAEVVARELDSIPGASPITAILLTHEHDDHAKGAGTLSRLLGAPVLANAGTLAAAGDLHAGDKTCRGSPCEHVTGLGEGLALCCQERDCGSTRALNHRRCLLHGS